MSKRRALLAMLLLWAPLVYAHKSSDSYLSLTLTDTALSGRWDIAVRDLDFAVGLDANGDRDITWGELRAQHLAIARYALGRLRLERAGDPCQLVPGAQLVDRHTDGAYTVLPFTATCPGQGSSLAVDYQLLFDLDPTHRGLLRVDYDGTNHAAVLSPARSRFEVVPASRTDHVGGAWRTFSDYWREGVRHIWTGFDHIAFLLSLLLPAVLIRHAGRWRGRPLVRDVLVDTAAVVTAFTVAHSITLSLAVLDFVSVPSRLVESAIAVTVVLAALNNLFPVIHGRRWVLAFGLGLVHGLGFASTLEGLGLETGHLGLSLAAFNLGVEAGQLALAAAFLPLACWWRHAPAYRLAALGVGSSMIAVAGAFWLLERGLNVSLPAYWELVAIAKEITSCCV